MVLASSVVWQPASPSTSSCCFLQLPAASLSELFALSPTSSPCSSPSGQPWALVGSPLGFFGLPLHLFVGTSGGTAWKDAHVLSCFWQHEVWPLMAPCLWPSCSKTASPSCLELTSQAPASDFECLAYTAGRWITWERFGGTALPHTLPYSQPRPDFHNLPPFPEEHFNCALLKTVTNMDSWIPWHIRYYGGVILVLREIALGMHWIKAFKVIPLMHSGLGMGAFFAFNGLAKLCEMNRVLLQLILSLLLRELLFCSSHQNVIMKGREWELYLDQFCRHRSERKMVCDKMVIQCSILARIKMPPSASPGTHDQLADWILMQRLGDAGGGGEIPMMLERCGRVEQRTFLLLLLNVKVRQKTKG